jgi:CCR4-NOT transcriptional regulation complex NOT5 subunit
MLQSSMADIPLPADSVVSFRDVVLRDPAATPAYYPQSAPAAYYSPATFKRLTDDTLFWVRVRERAVFFCVCLRRSWQVFYFQQGTPQQMFAAAELKKSFWRYHRSARVWLQRHPRELPVEVTGDYEKGSFVFFDNEDRWTQRTRADFVLEYAQIV